MPLNLPVLDRPTTSRDRPVVALVGNPNAGKTTLFNALTGLRASTANYAGTTIEKRVGSMGLSQGRAEIIDLPGLYGLTAGTVEERLARDVLMGAHTEHKPSAALVVVDATNLARNLYLTGQVRELGLPMVVALNMMDLVESQGLRMDVAALERELGAPVVPVSARSGKGLAELRSALEATMQSSGMGEVPEPLRGCSACGGCPHAARYAWAEDVHDKVLRGQVALSASATERIDRWLTHPLLGLLAFAAIMAGMFISIFWLADWPMGWIEDGIAALQAWVGARMAEGDLRSFVVDGVIGGVGSVLVFLPQICILFLLICLLEDTGYLARAALVMDKLMRRVGLPGRAFVPMLSAHACAIPAIMATRVIEDRRDRLVAILVIPLLTCSARLPVYAMVTALLFAGQPVLGALVFCAAYVLGATAALVTAWMLKKTLLPGQSAPFLMELPTYKMPSLRTALLTVLDRGVIFLKNAGTVILVISMVLWAMSTYPKMPEDRLADYATPEVMAQVRALQAQLADADEATAEELSAELDAIHGSYAMRYSMAGRIGAALEPVFAPLGFDWRINVGVVSSFAARETLVSTLAIVYAADADAADEPQRLRDTLHEKRRDDGTAAFSVPTSLSLLVFFVLAMQCLPTQVVTRRETGSWKWALFQIGYMTVLAYTAALITYQAASQLV